MATPPPPRDGGEKRKNDLLAQTWDIIIIGTGAAALSAALSAATTTSTTTTTTSSTTTTTKTTATAKPKILLVEKAPREWAGGNGFFTAAAYRTRHEGLSDLLPLVSNVPAPLAEKIDLPPYTAADFRGDLERVTGGRSDETLGGYLVGESLDVVRWLREVGGVDWWLSFRRQAYEVDGRWRFWGGLHLTVQDGGKGLIRNLLDAVRRHGCEISYETCARGLMTDASGRRVVGVEVERGGERYELRASSVILCAGGFEANPELRKKWMGPGWELAHTRGTPYNTGDMLAAAIELGAKTVGDFSPSGCHSVAWDADSPKHGGDRDKTNEFTKSGYPLGLMLNAEGKRFVDEGVDLRNYTYAKFGRAILEQPEGVAFQVWDRDGQQWLRSEEYRDEIVRKVQADSVEELADKLRADGLKAADEFVKTIEEYNEAVEAHRRERPEIRLNPAIKDGLSTQSSSRSLPLAKSNWAIPIRKPPFVAVKVTCGITFTFGGLAINGENAAVLGEDGREIEGLHCAGEMVGGLFYGNYPGGSGLTAGGVFGRRAGRAAATRAQEQSRGQTL
ncbi:FAD NAD(P)-binding domain-containing [Lecanosticta acicola]|uniref:FAD NAD(P)-binding domain-containing n=1 Tax=Lecanosticta acicola TaxID=111012 RepID=A0AAI8Z4I6_9PEZI|nr:FAD NAD(P)-binding domain-containing [Lecanosticta acicola]